jgi:hypothetical protein
MQRYAYIRKLPAAATNLRVSVMIPPRRSFWGDITMPMF